MTERVEYQTRAEDEGEAKPEEGTVEGEYREV